MHHLKAAFIAIALWSTASVAVDIPKLRLTIFGQGVVTGTGGSGGSITNNQILCTKVNATCLLLSSTNATTASTTVGAITLQAGAALDANDLVVDVQDSSNNHLFKIDLEGDTTAAGDIKISTAAKYGMDGTTGTNYMTFLTSKVRIFQANVDMLDIDGNNDVIGLHGALDVATAVSGHTQITLTPRSTTALDFPSVLTGQFADITVTVTGATAGAPCIVGPANGAMVNGASYTCWSQSANNATIRMTCNNTIAASCDPPNASFNVQTLNP